jgi:hypothetical protein
VVSLVVRGAVPLSARFPIPLSIRACGFPAHGFPMNFWTWLHSFRVADGAHGRVQALVVEPGTALQGSAWPGRRLRRCLMSKRFRRHVTNRSMKMNLCAAFPVRKVVAPAPKKPVQTCDDVVFQLLSDLASSGERTESLDPCSGTLHRPNPRPAVEVVPDDPLLLPELAGHAGTKVEPRKSKPSLPSRRSTTLVLPG